MNTTIRPNSLVAEVHTDLQALGLDREAALSGAWARPGIDPRALIDEAIAALSPKVLRQGDGAQYAEVLLAELRGVEAAVREAATRVRAELPDAPPPQGFIPSLLRIAWPKRDKSRADQIRIEIEDEARRGREHQLRRRYRLLATCGGVIAQLIKLLTQIHNDRSSYQLRAREALQRAESAASIWQTRLAAEEDQLPPRALSRLAEMLAAEPAATTYARGLQAVTQPRPLQPGETLPEAVMATAEESVRLATDIRGTLQELMGRLAEHLGWSPEEGRLNLARYLFAGASTDLVPPQAGVQPLYQVVPAGTGSVLGKAGSARPLPLATSTIERKEILGLLQIAGDLAVTDLPRPESSSASAAARIIRPGVTGERPRTVKPGLTTLEPPAEDEKDVAS